MSDTGFAALAAARWIHFASVMLLFGASLFTFYALPAQTISPEPRRARGVLRVAALLAFVSGLAWAAASLVNITGEIDSLSDRETLAAFLFDTGFGKVWALRLLLLMATLLVAFIAGAGLCARNFATALIALLTALLLISQAWIGHPAASTGGERNAIILGYALHVLGAGAWLGGLLPLWLIVRVRNAHDRSIDIALRRFSAVGMFAIAIILVGGLINLWARWNSLDALLASAWGKVLVAKLLGFIALVTIAIVNRFVLMPRLPMQGSPRARLMCNVLAEQAGGLAILAAAAILGILPPPA
ncbi:MAG: copper resistance protein [Methylobacteriaceae bacterium]|nr:copper resistance protein [Methylobacteriaceae bacterium]